MTVNAVMDLLPIRSHVSRRQLLANAAIAASRVAVVLGGLLAGRFDGLDVVHAAAIPSRAEPRAARRGDVIEQVRHRAVGSVLRDQFITTVGGSPIALAAANENGRALLVPQPVDGQSATAVAAS